METYPSRPETERQPRPIPADLREPPLAPVPPDIEFTAAHIAAATRAHTNGKVIVLDRGPRPPEQVKASEGERTPAEIEDDNRRFVLAKREHDEWHEKNKEPLAVEMYPTNATHAVAVEPERYVLVPRGLRAPVTLEERVARLELRMGPETPDEISARRDRDAKAAEAAARPAAEQNKVP